MLSGREIHLCVTGGIAAYKAVDLVRQLTKSGADVQVAMSENAMAFVGPLTFQSLTRRPVLTRTVDPSEELAIGHIEFAQRADVLVVAPATANSIGKAAVGIGDDVISTVLLAANIPVVLAPAMNTVMWENPSVQTNLETLRARGWSIVEPDSGELACGAVGAGRLADTGKIVAAIEAHVGPKDLHGRRVVVTAGPTREYLDPVRFLSNPSTGKMGLAVAQSAHRRGARVTFIHGPISETIPAGLDAVSITSAAEMMTQVERTLAGADALFMTAAVADWRPRTRHGQKQAKTTDSQQIELVRTPDILSEMGQRRRDTQTILVGWAAETHDLLARAQAKRERKNLDLVVANDVSQPDVGFASDTNQVILVESESETHLPMMSKSDLGETLIDWLVARLDAST